MSARSNHWCWAQDDVSPAELLVMKAISDRCDEEGFGSFQKIETIAVKAKMSERNVRRVVTELESRGKLKRHERPGRTTEIQIVIPPDFGGWKRADKMAGVGEDKSAGGGNSAEPLERADSLAGVAARADKMAGAPAKLAGGADNLAADSSLPIPSPQNTKDARARDGSEAVALTREERSELRVLDYEATRLCVSKRTANETFEHYRQRIATEVNSDVAARAQRVRREPSPTDPNEEAA